MSYRISLREDRELGTVEWWDQEIGRGCVRADADGAKLLVHHSKLSGVRNLYKDQRVLFFRVPDPMIVNADRAERVALAP